MGQISLGKFYGYTDSTYGVFNVLFNYTSSGVTLSSMSIKLSKDRDGKYTTNNYYIDSLKLDSTTMSCSPTSGSAQYSSTGAGPTITVSGTYTAPTTSVTVTLKMHRSGQSGSQTLTGTITGLATAPTGVTCGHSNVKEKTASLSGSYSSDGGTSVTATGYQYRLDGSSQWSTGSTSLTGLTPGKKYYYRYYATNIVGTTYSSEGSFTTYSYPYLKSISSSALTIGNNQTINLYNPLGRTCTLYCKQNNTSGTTLGSKSNGIDGNNTMTFTASTLYNSIPNSKTGNCVYYVYYLDENSSGHNSATISGTYKIKDNNTENPTFTSNNIIDVVDTLHTAITGNSSKFIQGHNILTGKIVKMTSNYGANLDYYSISANATSISPQQPSYSSSNISFTINNINSSSFEITGVDKRTLSTKATKSITMISYSLPTLEDWDLPRQNGIGDHATIVANGKYTNWSGLSQSNSIQNVKLYYKLETASSWTQYNGDLSLSTNSGGNWAINKLLDITFNTSSRYNVRLVITDKIDTSTFDYLIVSTANALIWRDLANKRVGIGKKPSANLDVEGNITCRNNQEVVTTKGRSNWDLNTIYDTEIVSVQSGSHYPSGSAYGVLLNMPYRKPYGNDKPDFGGQIFIPNGDDSTKPDSLFYRTSTGNDWRSWNEVAKKTDLNNVAYKNTDNSFSTGQTINGTLQVNGIIQSNNINGLRLNSNYSLTSDPTNSFQTTIFGSNNAYSRIKAIRASGSSYNGFPNYGASFVASVGDTHCFLSTSYNSANAYVGGGNADKIQWYKQIAWADQIPSVTTGSDVVTKSGGSCTLLSSTYAKYGNVVHLNIRIKATAQVNVGSNVFTGTISNTSLRPRYEAVGAGYNGSTSFLSAIQTDGGVSIRVLGANCTSGKEMGIQYTYIV